MSQDVHISSQTLVIPSHVTSRVYIHHNINIIESGVKLILTHSLLLFRACQNCPILTELRWVSTSTISYPVPLMGWTCCRWRFRWWTRENDLWQAAQLKGFSPVWILKCEASSCFVKNALGHIKHLWGNILRCFLFLKMRVVFFCSNILTK